MTHTHTHTPNERMRERNIQNLRNIAKKNIYDNDNDDNQ